MRTITSDQARINWRDTIDTAFAGGEVIIERYGKPMVAVVKFDTWQMFKRRYLAELDRLSKAIDDGDYVTQEELDTELKRRGLIE